MAITDLKFTESEFVNNDISSLPNQVVGQADFLKAKLDNIGKNMVALGRFNDLIDALTTIGSGVNADMAQNALQLNGHPSTYYGIASNEFKAMGTISGNINFDTISTYGAQKWQMAGVTNVPAGVDGYGMFFSFMQGGYTVQKIIDTAGRETSRFYGSSWTQWQSYMKYIKMLSGNDTLVNYSENGMYMLAGVTNSGIANFGGYGMLRVESYRPTSGNPYVKQVVCDTANQKWERVFNQASWTAWKQTIAV